MIIEFIVQRTIDLIILVMDLIPDVPDMPSAIVAGGDWAIEQVVGVSSFLVQLFSPPLFSAMLIVGITLISFDTIYHTVLWVLKKIPALSIR